KVANYNYRCVCTIAKIADEVWPPVAVADYSDLDHHLYLNSAKVLADATPLARSLLVGTLILAVPEDGQEHRRRSLRVRRHGSLPLPRRLRPSLRSIGRT